MRKKIALASALILSMVLAGCSPDSGSKPASNASALSASANSSSVPAKESSTLVFYRPTDDALHILPVFIKVKAEDHTAKNAVEEMIRYDRKAKYPFIPADTHLKDLSIQDGTAIANFTDEVNQIKGGTSESLFIAMTVDTLTEFPNIKRVEFRAEGKPLQFQMDMTKQFMRDESYIQQTKT